MPTIQLEALDTLFFRDGKPFSMGDDTFAEGTFPPSPSVIYGALRSAFIAERLHQKDLEQLIQDSADLEITDMAYAFKGKTYYPMPLDYVAIKSDKIEVIPLKLITGVACSSDVKYLCISPSKYKHVESLNEGVFDTPQFGEYLDGEENPNPIGVKKWSDLIKAEEKFGNQRDKTTRSTNGENGNLYRVVMQRPQDFKLIISYKFNSTQSINLRLLKLGAEGKTATLKNYPNHQSIESEELSDKTFRVIFTTMSLFEKGSVFDISKMLKKNKIQGYEIEFLTSVIGKPKKIGGWDIAEGKPKSMLQAIPEGSVYYFKITNNKTVEELRDELIQKNVYSFSEYRSKEGFGLFKIANLNLTKKIIQL